MQLDDLTKDRLLMLCSYMESLPEKADQHFRMKTFLTHADEGHSHAMPEFPAKEDLLTCGTSACALGWGTTMPELQALGLRFKQESWGAVVTGENKVFPGLDSDAGDEQSNRWSHLFEGYNQDETPRQWAARARKLINEWSQPGAETEEPDY